MAENPTGRKRIVLLPPDVVNRIAAGEVIQRPASVVKELIENSIDAGSTNITVRIVGAGLKAIRIIDNGQGIHPDDFPLLCTRHATSKLQTYKDIEKLTSFGFRGEALASMSYVAQVEIVSNHVRALYEAGRQVRVVEQTPEIKGTTITIQNLFSTMPVRRESFRLITELRRIMVVIRAYAMEQREIRFRVEVSEGLIESHNTNTTVTLYEPRERMYERVNDIMSTEYEERDLGVVEIDRCGWGSDGGHTTTATTTITHGESEYPVKGLIVFVHPHSVGTATGIGSTNKGRASQTSFTFINHRLVKSSIVSVINRALAPYLPVRVKTPFLLVSLVVPPSVLDPNIHPTKELVALENEEYVYRLIEASVSSVSTRDISRKDAKDTRVDTWAGMGTGQRVAPIQEVIVRDGDNSRRTNGGVSDTVNTIVNMPTITGHNNNNIKGGGNILTRIRTGETLIAPSIAPYIKETLSTSSRMSPVSYPTSKNSGESVVSASITPIPSKMSPTYNSFDSIINTDEITTGKTIGGGREQPFMQIHPPDKTIWAMVVSTLPQVKDSNTRSIGGIDSGHCHLVGICNRRKPIVLTQIGDKLAGITIYDIVRKVSINNLVSIMRRSPSTIAHPFTVCPANTLWFRDPPLLTTLLRMQTMSIMGSTSSAASDTQTGEILSSNSQHSNDGDTKIQAALEDVATLLCGWSDVLRACGLFINTRDKTLEGIVEAPNIDSGTGDGDGSETTNIGRIELTQDSLSRTIMRLATEVPYTGLTLTQQTTSCSDSPTSSTPSSSSSIPRSYEQLVIIVRQALHIVAEMWADNAVAMFSVWNSGNNDDGNPMRLLVASWLSCSWAISSDTILDLGTVLTTHNSLLRAFGR